MMDRSEAFQIAYKNIRDDYKEFSGEDFNMTWDEQAIINVAVWDSMEDKSRFYEENPLYVYDALAYYGKIPVKIHPLLKVLPKDARILDFGCGTCCDLLALSLLGYDVTGVDVESNHVNFGKWRLNKYNSTARVLHEFPVDSHFDVVYSYDVLEHLWEWQPHIENLCNVGDMLILAWKFDDEKGTFPIHLLHNNSEVVDFIESKGFERDLSLIIPRLPRIWRRVKEVAAS